MLPKDVRDVVDDPVRLAALRQLGLVAHRSDERFDRIVRIAARALGTDRAVISLVEEERQWFIAREGVDLTGTPIGQSFCAHAIADPAEILVIPDSLADSRFADNPLVAGDDPIRFYAGVPLLLGDGLAAGTLCAFDREPRPGGLSAVERAQLTDLAAIVVAEIESDRQVHRANVVRDELRHRMGNIYAQMSSLVSLMGRSFESREELVARLQERIAALAATQALLTQGSASGVSLACVARDSLAAYRNMTQQSRIAVQEGDDLSISQRCVFAATLMFGELASNAVRHGALAAPDGRVHFGWRRDGDMVRLDWKESGIVLDDGTVGDGAPRRVGFGSAILGRIVPAEFGGKAELVREPDGIRYVLTAPYDRCCT